MTTEAFLKHGVAELTNAGVGTARLDMLILLEDVLDIDRALLLAHPETIVSQSDLIKLRAMISERSRHVPLAYIRGVASFYGRDFQVTKAVLVPRPETEDMITLLKKINLADSPLLADIGTGSGCIAITAALALPGSKVEASDISPAAITLARQNNVRWHAQVVFAVRDLLTGATTAYDALLANLPYVPDMYEINAAAAHEPTVALFAGPDGLDAYRRLFAQIGRLPTPPPYVLIEALPMQHGSLATLARAHGYTVLYTAGYVQAYTRF